jgi:IS30 family transposase
VTEETEMGQEQDTTKKRTWEQINEKDRYKIEALSHRGLTPYEIGEELGRHRRTIERELARGMTQQRNSDLTEKRVYLADVGQRKHDERSANKGRGWKIGHDHKLAEHIERKIIGEKYSPDAVIGEIKVAGLRFDVTVCTKTVYNMIDAGIFRKLSNNDLPVKRDNRKRQYGRVRKVALNNRNGKSITERPREADERTEQGHWEIDLVVGRQGTKAAILTLVDRKTRKSLYVLVKNKTQKEVIAAIKRVSRRAGGSFHNVFKTITADNGSEFLDSEAIKKAANCGDVYYAHPYSSWERGSNENGNRLLRRFVPKGTDIGKLTHRELQRIEDWVNNYPRRIFGYKSSNNIAA